MEFSTSIHHSKSKPDCNGKVEYILIWKVSSFFIGACAVACATGPVGYKNRPKKLEVLFHSNLTNYLLTLMHAYFSYFIPFTWNALLVDFVNFKIIAILAKDGIHMPFAFFNMHSIKDFQLHQARRMTKKGN